MLNVEAPSPSPDPPAAPVSNQEVAHRPPERAVEPLTGRGPPPLVKRFNRWTAGILLAVVGVVAILAFGTAFTRKHPFHLQEASSAETTAASPSASDAINNLPSSYSDVPRIGPPQPGEVGAILAGSPRIPGTAAETMNVPLTVPVVAPRADTEPEKLALRVRESGFGFGGGGAGASPETANPLAQLASLAGVPTAPLGAIPVRSDRDADNRQDDKAEFLERSRAGRWELKDGIHAPPSRDTIFAGTVIPGVLLTGIDSDLPGQIEGQISQNVYDSVRGEHLVLPQGTKLLGSYDSRIFIDTQRRGVN